MEEGEGGEGSGVKPPGKGVGLRWDGMRGRVRFIPERRRVVKRGDTRAEASSAERSGMEKEWVKPKEELPSGVT